MFKNLTIRARLVAVLSMLSILLLAVGGAGLAGLGRNHDALRTVYEERLMSLGHLDNMMRIMLRNQLALHRAANSAPAALPAAIEQIEQDRDATSRLWQQYSASFASEEEKEIAERFDAARKHFMLDALAPALVAGKAGDIETMRALVNGPIEHMFPKIRIEMDKLIAYQLEHGRVQYAMSAANYARQRTLVTALLAAGFVLVAVVGRWLVRSITVPLNRAVAVAQAVARGDLTQQIEVRTHDETGKLLAALKEMNANLAAMAGHVRQSAQDIAAASGQVACGSLHLSQRTASQAKSLEETAASMEELASIVRQHADNARQANHLAQRASHATTRGGAAVFLVFGKMEAIRQASRSLEEVSGAAECAPLQAGLLELDAAVAAAHAIMGEVVQAVHQVGDTINEITAASHEQSVGIDQLNGALIQIDADTQRNAALVEQAAGVAAAMQRQSAVLSEAACAFRLVGEASLASRHSNGAVRAPAAANTPHSHQISLA
ncbi:Tar ligand binding domain-containing protein [Pseudoduganella sp. R-43]|uniref:Tar ligand binding domain-containing protein n=1 Tax=unclassified Pseudoduganella TaxID=2637179 RepID=UPI003CE9A15B